MRGTHLKSISSANQHCNDMKSITDHYSEMSKSPAVNFHLLRACDSKCTFCFATFRDISGQLEKAESLRLIQALRDSGVEKINFAGGEPTLHPHLGELIGYAKSLGLVTSIVTNGARLHQLLDKHSDDLDWVGLSIDSADERVQAELGRGRGDHVHRALMLADRCRQLGVRLKLNTVVTSLNWEENMSTLVRLLRPERWKVFQVLPMKGQNDGRVTPLLITPSQFRAFVTRHEHLSWEGFEPVVEDNDAMRGSYVMIDPLGRFFGNATGTHIYSDPILNVGVLNALRQVGFVPEKFEARAGRYDW